MINKSLSEVFKKEIRFSSIAFFLIIIGANIYAQENSVLSQNLGVPFNVSEIIERVSQHSRSGEFLIDTNIVYSPASYSQESPAVAFDGTNYLVVWQDYHNNDDTDIYGARVDQSGKLLDSAGISISTAIGYQYYPAVAFDGTNYFVVWQDKLSGSCPSYIYGARVNQSGMVLDPSGIAISTAVTGGYASVVFGNTNYLVVWGGDNIYGTRVNQFGTVLDPSGITISNATNRQDHPSVAFDGRNYLVVWEDGRNGAYNADIYGARVEQSGIVLDPSGIAISTATYDQWEPSVAFDGTNYLVVWVFNNINLWSDIYGARVNQSGIVLDPTGIAISTDASLEYSPAVVFDGINYLVVWHDRPDIFSGDVYGARVAKFGVILDTTRITISDAVNLQLNASVGFDGTNYLVVWQDIRSGSSDIYSARMDQSGTILDSAGITISFGVNRHFTPSATFGDTNYLVVWTDNRSFYADIYGARLNQLGAVLDSVAISISTVVSSSQWQPAVAFDGTNYLVVWADRRNGTYADIYGARVDQSGAVLDTGIAISTASYHQVEPTVAFDGTNYLVVWRDYRGSSGDNSDIYGARVDQSGIVLNTIAISTAVSTQYNPSVVFGGTNYLVVWGDKRSGFYADIYGARVNKFGIVLDSAGIAISTAAEDQQSPSVAFDGANYLVVWEDERSGRDIYGTRVDRSGTVLDPSGVAISTATGVQGKPTVAFDGTNYLVIWEDSRSGLYTDIYGAKVNLSGTVIDSFTVSLQSGHQLSPALAHGQGEQMFITYSGWTDYINQHPAYTMRTWGKLYPFTDIEETEVSNLKSGILNLSVYPNPFSKKTEIQFRNYDLRSTMIRIYDATGRLVRSFPISQLTNLKSLINYVSWDATDDIGRRVSPGVYFVQINTDNYKSQRKVIFVH